MDYIKDSGTWKEVETPYIKVNGHWTESDKQYIKVGGKWADTSNLSAVAIEYDGVVASNTDGSRYLVNKSEPTSHKAPMHSGSSIKLFSTGEVVVPGSTVYAFDFSDNTFKTFTSPIKNRTIGVIASLDSSTFTQADIDAFNARPELIIDWYFGTATIPSAIVKGANDKVYYPIDGSFIELGYVIDNTEHGNGFLPINTSGVNSTITGSASDGSGGGKGQIRPNTLSNTIPGSLDARLLDVSFDVSNMVGTTSTISYFNGTAYVPMNIPIVNGRIKIISPRRKGSDYIMIRIDSNTVWSFDYANLSVKEITSEYLVPSGKISIETNSMFGIQLLKLKGYPVPTATSVNIEGSIDGRWINLPLVDNTKKHHFVVKCLKEIKGDITQITETPCVP